MRKLIKWFKGPARIARLEHRMMECGLIITRLHWLETLYKKYGTDHLVTPKIQFYVRRAIRCKEFLRKVGR
jgi:hypothetical protein